MYLVQKNEKLNNETPDSIVKEKDEVEVHIPDPPISDTFNAEFKICPDCSSKSLKTENGCDMCVECGYSKCDK